MTEPVLDRDKFSWQGQEFGLKNLAARDIPLILDIEARSHKTPWSKGNFESSVGHHVCIGLCCNARLCGYAIVSFVVGEAELLLLVIDKPLQGRGVGKRFLMLVLEYAREKAQQIFLEVRQANKPAIGLYESVGFNQVGVRPNYYPSNTSQKEDAWLYALELSLMD